MVKGFVVVKRKVYVLVKKWFGGMFIVCVIMVVKVLVLV